MYPQVHSLVGELRAHWPRGEVKEEENKIVWDVLV